QSVRGGFQGAVIYQKFIIRLLLEEPRNPIRVIRSGLEASKDQHLESPLQELQPLPWIVYPWIVYRRHTTYSLQRSTRRQAPTRDPPTLLPRLHHMPAPPNP